jgi:hypothetical protein
MTRNAFGAALVSSLLIAGAGPVHADQCTAAKLKAVSKAAYSLARCQSKVAATNDGSILEECRIKTAGKLADAFAQAGPCVGDLAECQTIASRCEAEIADAFADTFPSKCESAKRKAAGKLVKAELACYAKAAARDAALDPECITKAAGRFASALTKAGACPQSASPLDVIESGCVAPAIVVDGGNLVTEVCPATVCCDGPTTILGALVCTGGATAAACTAAGGTPVDSAVCDLNGCVTPPGDPNGCCEIDDDCTMADAASCSAFGGIHSSLAVCEESGGCAPRPCDGGPLEIICGGACTAGKVCSAVIPPGGSLTCVCTSGAASCGGLGCGDGCPSGTTCQAGTPCRCEP